LDPREGAELNKITITSRSFGKNGKTCQISFVFEGLMFTRHLKLIGGKWMGRSLYTMAQVPYQL
jgi:hypothetical protein